MTYKANTVHNGQLFIRCTHCGDSERRAYVGHLAINVESGLYYCHRCGASGKLDFFSLVALLNEHNIEGSSISEYSFVPTNVPFSKDTRHSVLPSFIEEYKGTTYRFWYSKTLDGSIVGKYGRRLDESGNTVKENTFVGTKAFGYAGKALVSTDVIRVVEGVYDCVYPNDVCVFGKLTYTRLKPLRFHRLLLAMDSDCVFVLKNLEYTYGMVQKLYSEGFLIEGIEIFEYPLDASDYYREGERGTVVSANHFLAKAKELLKKSPNF